ncbi:MFS transporter [Psychrobacillus sp.]|uniref:MFS transporter n=1 Tax=Psychrobacillus sp. TaxID=1871623 RepID=UPI0028BDA7D9|nr:MFS transporter [Psychrobacillus sp.]
MQLFHEKAFRNLFAGRVLSVFADSIVFFSLLKWIELNSINSTSFTWFYIAYFLPMTLFALPIGAWIENKTLQKVMAFSDGIRVFVLVIFLLTMSFIQVEWTYFMLMIISILSLFFVPASQSLLPFIVKQDDRAKANSLFQLGFTVVKMIGQISTASLIKLGIPIPMLLLIAAICLSLSLLFIWNVKPWSRREAAEKTGQWRMMIDGIGYIATHSTLKPLFLLLAFAMLIATSIDLVLISFLTEYLKVGVENLSFIGTSTLIGIIIGASITPKWYRKVDRKNLIVPSLFAICLSLGVLFIVPTWWLILPLFIMQGIALGVYQVTFVTYLQDVVPQENMTRTFSLFNMITSSMALPGIIVFGILLNKIGTMNTISVMVIALLLIAITSCFSVPALGKGGRREAS